MKKGFLNPNVAKAVGAMLMAVSMVFTVQLLVSFAKEGDIFNKLVFTTFGVAIQTAQTLLFLYYCIQKKPFHAVLWAFLFVLSLCGSLGFFAVGDSTQKQISIQADARYGLLMERKNTLQAEIESTNQTIAEYAKGEYFSNGVKPTQQLLKDLRRQQEETHQQLMNFTADPPQESLYGFLSMLSGERLSVKQVKLCLFGAYAVALDLVSVALLGIFIQQQVRSAGGYIPQNGDSVSVPERITGTDESGRSGLTDKNIATAGDDRGGQTVIAEKDSSGVVPVPTETVVNKGIVPTAVPTESVPRTSTSTVQGIDRYINALFDSQKPDGSFRGRRAIADDLGITNREADQYHGHLKNAGVIEVQGNRTFPKTDRPAALAAVS